MRLSALFCTLNIFLFGYAAQCQEIIPVDISNRCVFSGGYMDSELYRFEEYNRVSEWVQEILDLGGAERNFELVQTNVENVSAVVDGNRRYLFYSIDFIQRATRVQVYASLAHEIGHHANEHTLHDAHRDLEESEADFFMGYVLSKKGIPKDTIRELLRNMSSSYGIALERRLKSVLDGYYKADQSLMIRSLQLENDPRLENLLLPTFSFMDCYTTAEMDRGRFAGLSTLGAVNDKICRALNQRGYRNRSYFSVKNGFAIVTQMEQYNRTDATPRGEDVRWLSNPARESFAGLMDYITATIWPNKGYFRLFVFVVTDSPYRSSGERVNKKDAEAWLCKGANRLPKEIAGKLFTADHTVSALVYEFEVPESTLRARQICPTPYFNAGDHLKRAGLGF